MHDHPHAIDACSGIALGPFRPGALVFEPSGEGPQRAAGARMVSSGSSTKLSYGALYSPPRAVRTAANPDAGRDTGDANGDLT